MRNEVKIPDTVTFVDGLPVVIRCPACHQGSTLDGLKGTHDFIIVTRGAMGSSSWVGLRVCPNPSCRLLILVVYRKNQAASKITSIIEYTVPRERIDFDTTGIPGPIVAALEEAIACHANDCYVAAAIMVRKTLEELCREQNASGKRLVDQINDLKSKVIVPTGILDGIDNLRLLGNDAAHVELKDYDKIEAEEVEVGILFAKELLKAVYQSFLLTDRLNALKKTS